MHRLILIACLFAAVGLGADRGPQERDLANVFIGDILPQIAVGGAWSTEIQVMNARFDDVAESFTIRFLDENGNAMALPVVGQGMQTSVSGVVQPRGVAFFELAGGASTLVGAALAESGTSGGVVMNAVLTKKVDGRPDFQASVPSTDRFGTNFQFPFRNDGPYTTTVAFLSNADQTLTAIARDAAGIELCRVEQQMTAGQHVSFLVSDLAWLPCTADAQGVIEIVPAEGGSGTMIAFLFNDQGAFTTQIPFEIGPDE
ncbi:MAG: hypothetical protein O3A53_08275 [Acidobacteria bacterium]|nr:hypothetical protein [Acidobacteriota bacterium]MDA1234783.1 hypothetical protein [Acidobacteriota bacterium]